MAPRAFQECARLRPDSGAEQQHRSRENQFAGFGRVVTRISLPGHNLRNIAEVVQVGSGTSEALRAFWARLAGLWRISAILEPRRMTSAVPWLWKTPLSHVPV